MRRRYLAMVLVSGLLLAVVAALLALFGRREAERTPQSEPPVAQLPVVPVKTSIPFPDTGIALALTPDGKFLVVASTLRVWDLETNREVTGFVNPDKAEGYVDVAISPDGKAVAVAGQVDLGERYAGVVRVWDFETRQLRWTAPQKWDVRCVAWSPDGSRLAAGSGYDGTVTIWNADGTNKRVAWPPPGVFTGGTVGYLAWSHDGKRIVHESSSAAHVWDVESGREVAVAIQETFHNRREFWRGRPLGVGLESHGPFTAFAFAPDDCSMFVTGRITGNMTNGPITGDVWVWDLESNRESRKLADSPSGIVDVALGLGGRSLVTADFGDVLASDRTINVHGWDTTTGGKLWTLSARTDEGPRLGRFAITPNHRRLAIQHRANGGKWFVNVYDLPPP